MSQEALIGLLILIIFAIATGLMVTRKLPALLTLPLMGAAIAGGAWAIQQLLPDPDQPSIALMDIFQGVLTEGSVMLHMAMIVAFFGGMLSFLMQKSGTAESLVKQGAELIGDNPLGVSIFSMLLIALLFTSIGGLGAVIMVAMVVLPMLATVGVQPVVAGGIMLIGISMGGILNAASWVIYTSHPFNLQVQDIKGFAVVLFLLTGGAGLVFVCVELLRSGVLRSKRPVILTLVLSLLGGGILLLFLPRLMEGSTAGVVSTNIAVHDPAQRDFLRILEQEGRVQHLMLADQAVFRLEPPHDEDEPFLVIERNGGDGREYFPGAWEDFSSLSFSYTANVKGKLFAEFLDRTTGSSHRIPALARTAGASHQVVIAPRQLQQAGVLQVDSISFSFIPYDLDADRPIPPEQQGTVTISLRTMILKPMEAVGTAGRLIRWGVGAGLAFIVLLVLLDIRQRVRRWRHQVITIKWYAYLIPIVPLLLILVYNMPPLTAFLLGFLYAVLVTARPGSISLTIQSMLQGASAVIPAVMLMVGIGILIRSVLGPSGWSEAHGGALWPVLASIQPYFSAVVPSSPLGYVLVFGVCAPLALYRGPLNVWGLGFGVGAIIIASGSVAPLAVMAMLLTVGQVQGICDPTNTHNVWLANELRVDVQALMWRTIPYVWGMVFVGLTVAAFMAYR